MYLMHLYYNIIIEFFNVYMVTFFIYRSRIHKYLIWSYKFLLIIYRIDYGHIYMSSAGHLRLKEWFDQELYL